MEKKKILIIEDNVAILDIMAQILSGEGMEVVTAPDGRAGLALLKDMEKIPDLLLVDFMMPIMDGLEFRLHQLADDKFSEIPFVLLTAATSIPVQPAHGKILILHKPITLDKLLKLVDSCG